MIKIRIGNGQTLITALARYGKRKKETEYDYVEFFLGEK
jgi:hypothetical protein